MVAAFNNFINLTGNLNPFDQGNRAGKDADGHAAPRPRVKSFDQIRANLLQPALTSHFIVHITEPQAKYGWAGVKAENNVETIGFANKQDQLMLLCSEALLPGSTFATHQITSDRTGVTERHVYRRQFDDRIDLTFLVNAGENAYLPIRFFETWMKFISAEGNQQGNSVRNPAYSYRVRYPDHYYGGLTVTKFERSHDSEIKYNFLNAYPTSIVSMPVSYDTSQLMKCTVSFSYVRYWIDEVPGEANPPTSDVMDYNKPGPPSKPVIAPPPKPDGKPLPPNSTIDSQGIEQYSTPTFETPQEKKINEIGAQLDQQFGLEPGTSASDLHKNRVTPKQGVEVFNQLNRDLKQDQNKQRTPDYIGMFGAPIYPPTGVKGSGTGGDRNFAITTPDGRTLDSVMKEKRANDAKKK